MSKNTKEELTIIFLDVDGVLNHHKSMKFNKLKRKYRSDIPDKRCVENLGKIVKATGAKIVLTSTWRKMVKYSIFESMLSVITDTDALYNTFIGQIDDIDIHRGYEIMLWIIRQNSGANYWSSVPRTGYPVTRLVILDDDYIMPELSKYHITTRLDSLGLNDKITKNVIKFLKSDESLLTDSIEFNLLKPRVKNGNQIEG